MIYMLQDGQNGSFMEEMSAVPVNSILCWLLNQVPRQLCTSEILWYSSYSMNSILDFYLLERGLLQSQPAKLSDDSTEEELLLHGRTPEQNKHTQVTSCG